MRKETISALHVINIVLQSIFNLLWQIGIMLVLAWLATDKLSWPMWVYVPFILFGTLTGVWSMLKFILSASKNLERLEEEHRQSEKKNKSDKKNMK